MEVTVDEPIGDFPHTTKGEKNQVKAVACPSNSAQAGRAAQCEGCPGQALCRAAAGGVDPDQEALSLRMNAIKHKILVLSGKGGVGKSNVACQLAVALTKRGNKVGLLDVDICGPSVPTIMAVVEGEVLNSPYGWIPVKSPVHDIAIMSIGFMMENKDSAVVWRGPRKTALIKRFLKDTFWGKLDYLLIDTPPGTSDEHLTVVAALKSSRPDGAIIVTTPQEISLSVVKKEQLTFCQRMGVPVLGIVENMSGFVCPCCSEVTEVFSHGGGEKLAKEWNIPFLGKLPLDPRVSQCADGGVAVLDDFPQSPAAKAIESMLDNLLAILSKKD